MVAIKNQRRWIGRRVCGLFSLWVFVSGCGGPAERPVRDTHSFPSAESWRIVCGTPALAEIVFALGAGERVVGVSDYTVWPPEARVKPSIGGWVNPDRERLAMLHPDIILTQGMHERLAAFAQELGVRFCSIPLERYTDILEQMEAVGVMLGLPENGRALRARVEADLAEVHGTVAAAAPRKVVVLFARSEGDMAGLTAIGPGTFLNDLIEVAGGVNIFRDAYGDYPQISKESLLMRQPDVIIELHAEPMTEARRGQVVGDWQQFGALPAVRNGRIVLLTDDFLLIPGPRMALTASRLARAIHPECFDE